MRLFGGIIPFVGWREVHVDEDGNPCEGYSDWLADVLEVEWLGCGVCLYVGKVWARGER